MIQRNKEETKRDREILYHKLCRKMSKKQKDKK